MIRRIQLTVIVSIAVLITGVAGYWFGVRPARIFSNCQQEYDQQLAAQRDYDPLAPVDALEKVAENVYQLCLRRHGVDR